MKRYLFIALASGAAACCGKKEVAQGGSSSDPGSTVAATAPALVYRTSTDHRDHVPVLLSDDRSRIVSYPHPKDLRMPSGYPTPTPLGKDYLLDNRGIGLNVAFLDMTYEQYAALQEAPSLEKLDALIIDRDPLVELCDCGKRSQYKDVAKELAAYVGSGELMKHCKKLK